MDLVCSSGVKYILHWCWRLNRASGWYVADVTIYNMFTQHVRATVLFSVMRPDAPIVTFLSLANAGTPTWLITTKTGTYMFDDGIYAGVFQSYHAEEAMRAMQRIPLAPTKLQLWKFLVRCVARLPRSEMRVLLGHGFVSKYVFLHPTKRIVNGWLFSARMHKRDMFNVFRKKVRTHVIDIAPRCWGKLMRFRIAMRDDSETFTGSSTISLLINKAGKFVTYMFTGQSYNNSDNEEEDRCIIEGENVYVDRPGYQLYSTNISFLQQSPPPYTQT